MQREHTVASDAGARRHLHRTEVLIVPRRARLEDRRLRGDALEVLQLPAARELSGLLLFADGLAGLGPLTGPLLHVVHVRIISVRVHSRLLTTQTIANYEGGGTGRCQCHTMLRYL